MHAMQQEARTRFEQAYTDEIFADQFASAYRQLLAS